MPDFRTPEAALLQPDGAFGYRIGCGCVAARHHPSLRASRSGAREDHQDVAGASDGGGSGTEPDTVELSGKCRPAVAAELDPGVVLVRFEYPGAGPQGADGKVAGGDGPDLLVEASVVGQAQVLQGRSFRAAGEVLGRGLRCVGGTKRALVGPVIGSAEDDGPHECDGTDQRSRAQELRGVAQRPTTPAEANDIRRAFQCRLGDAVPLGRQRLVDLSDDMAGNRE